MEEYYFYTEGLTVGYHGVPLIKNIKISLKKGEILTLIGPNGAGKTTILRSIIKQLKPLGGVVVLDGKETEQISGKELSRKLSVVLTERVRPEMMTCKEVVATGRYPYTGKFGVLSKEDWKLVDEAMELVHIHELADRDFSKTPCPFRAVRWWKLQRLFPSTPRLLCWTSRPLFWISAISWNFYPSSRICPGNEIFP